MKARIISITLGYSDGYVDIRGNSKEYLVATLRFPEYPEYPAMLIPYSEISGKRFVGDMVDVAFGDHFPDIIGE